MGPLLTFRLLLQIADTLFRRQFLFQLLILLQHLLHFTQSEKAKWAVQRNRSLHMDFTLSPTDAKWAQDTWIKAMDELKATTPNGKAFADTVAAILDRERNWVRCTNFIRSFPY
jgi:THO complex subunit 1